MDFQRNDIHNAIFSRRSKNSIIGDSKFEKNSVGLFKIFYKSANINKSLQ